jgi:restriction system protein
MAQPNERFTMDHRKRMLLLLNRKPTLQIVESAPLFSFGAIVKVEFAIPDGQIITLIDPAYSYLVGVIEKNPEIIYQIDPRKWEEIVAAAYDKAGFDEVILTPRSGDFGRDVIAIKKGFGSIKFIDQVKAYKQGHIVIADEVRALLGVLSGEQDASKAIFTTTSTFAPKIEDDKFIKPFLPYRLELVDKEKLIARLLSQGGPR